jgi:hypothetical protein
VGVLQVEVDSQGYVPHLNWMRAPKHAPEVMAQIEKTVREAAPFRRRRAWARWSTPTPGCGTRAAGFQLDTLTEGQD